MTKTRARQVAKEIVRLCNEICPYDDVELTIKGVQEEILKDKEMVVVAMIDIMNDYLPDKEVFEKAKNIYEMLYEDEQEVGAWA